MTIVVEKSPPELFREILPHLKNTEPVLMDFIQNSDPMKWRHLYYSARNRNLPEAIEFVLDLAQKSSPVANQGVFDAAVDARDHGALQKLYESGWRLPDGHNQKWLRALSNVDESFESDPENRKHNLAACEQRLSLIRLVKQLGANCSSDPESSISESALDRFNHTVKHRFANKADRTYLAPCYNKIRAELRCDKG